ncbi:MAG: tyrosine-type recombinase/integrase [Synergistaceae bacterium]|jgi:integrase|nr:tyrosine-type recombinase/integrase [Synergistaceae bacterium]
MEVDPIRDVKKIAEIKKFLRARGERDEVLFVMGINTALRIGDLLSLTIGDVMDKRGEISRVINLKEQKTGKLKRFPVNESIQKTLSPYLLRRSTSNMLEPLFLSQKGGTLSRWQAWRILRAAGEFVGLRNVGTHSLRKTFGYHVYKKSGGDIGLVQKLLNHSASSVTLRYIGIDREMMDNIYLELNL